MVQIYCPNCKRQLWGVRRGGQRAPRRGEDTHPHVPGGRCPCGPSPARAAAPRHQGLRLSPQALGLHREPWVRGLGWAAQAAGPFPSLQVLAVASESPRVPPVTQHWGQRGPAEPLGCQGSPKGQRSLGTQDSQVSRSSASLVSLRVPGMSGWHGAGLWCC